MRFITTSTLVGLFAAAMVATAVAEENMVDFPAVSACQAMTTGPREHLFASYYGINSWDSTQRYATVLQTDTYPNNKLREQKLYLMDMPTEAVLPLGRYVQPPKFKGHWWCDLHPRWSPKGDMIGFNSTFTGQRQVYFLKLAFAR